MKCVHCKNQTKEIKGSFKHPYCPKCWSLIWEGAEKHYYNWLKYHNTFMGYVDYKNWLIFRGIKGVVN